MERNEKKNFELEKNEYHLNYQGCSLSTSWQFGNPSVSLVEDSPSASSSGPPVTVADSFAAGLWNPSSHNLGTCESNVGMSLAATIDIPAGNSLAGPSGLDLGWNPSYSLSKGGTFLPPVHHILPPSVASFQADSSFIERAARYSRFNGGNLGAMMNPFGTMESLSPHSNASRGALGQSKSDINAGEDFDGLGNPKEQRDLVSSIGVGASKNESGEPELNEDGQEETSNVATGVNPTRGPASKKRKRPNQGNEMSQEEGPRQLLAESAKGNAGNDEKGDEKSSSLAAGKSIGRQTKDTSDAEKEEYIHVRARRGQATNSHSLAERVRREKISERMKFLQDLVPGCSKVTGKAVMLDEIINYVQSLQRQVEFLSMKLAAVNPRLDFNIEGVLSKDLLLSHGGPSSAIGFLPDIAPTQLHSSQHGLVQAGMLGIVNTSDAFRRAINAQLTANNGYKEPPHQLSNAWDGGFHNVMQMAHGPGNTQELNGKPQDGFSN